MSVSTGKKRAPSAKSALSRMSNPDDITISDLEEKLAFMAKIIQLHGDVYWPIFERLENELKARKY